MTADDPRARLRSAYDDFVADPSRQAMAEEEGMSRCFHCGQETGTLFVDAEGIARCVTCHAMANTYGITVTTPSDDGEPITASWWVEEFGSDILVLNSTQSIQRFGEVPVLVHHGRFPHRQVPHDEPLYQIKTRGQLRQLLAALGWRGEEKG